MRYALVMLLGLFSLSACVLEDDYDDDYRPHNEYREYYPYGRADYPRDRIYYVDRYSSCRGRVYQGYCYLQDDDYRRARDWDSYHGYDDNWHKHRQAWCDRHDCRRDDDRHYDRDRHYDGDRHDNDNRHDNDHQNYDHQNYDRHDDGKLLNSNSRHGDNGRRDNDERGRQQQLMQEPSMQRRMQEQNAREQRSQEQRVQEQRAQEQSRYQQLQAQQQQQQQAEMLQRQEQERQRERMMRPQEQAPTWDSTRTNSQSAEQPSRDPMRNTRFGGGSRDGGAGERSGRFTHRRDDRQDSDSSGGNPDHSGGGDSPLQ